MPQPSQTYPRLFFKTAHLKSRLLWGAAGFWVFLLVAILPARAQDSSVVQLGAFNYPPFYYEEDSRICGIAVELIDVLFERLDIQPRLTLYPLKRALEYAREGKIDGIMILIKTDERAAYLEFTDPVMTVRGLIWSRADRIEGPVEFHELTDLQSYKMGATLGYSYGQGLDTLMKTMAVEWVASDYLNYKKLLAGRIDIFPGNEIVAKGLFKRHTEFQGKFVHSNRSFIEWTLHMGISKRSHLVKKIPEINSILSEMHAQGSLEQAVKIHTE